MSYKEAKARIKINKLLEAAGWRFFADGSAPANIQLRRVRSTHHYIDSFGAWDAPYNYDYFMVLAKFQKHHSRIPSLSFR